MDQRSQIISPKDPKAPGGIKGNLKSALEARGFEISKRNTCRSCFCPLLTGKPCCDEMKKEQKEFKRVLIKNMLIVQ